MKKRLSKTACPRFALLRSALCGGGFSKVFSLSKGVERFCKRDMIGKVFVEDRLSLDIASLHCGGGFAKVFSLSKGVERFCKRNRIGKVFFEDRLSSLRVASLRSLRRRFRAKIIHFERALSVKKNACGGETGGI